MTYFQKHLECINLIKADYFLPYMAVLSEIVDIIDLLICLEKMVQLHLWKRVQKATVK